MQDKKLVIILHNIRSAYNVGAIMRSVDGAGADRLYLTGYTPSPADEDKDALTKADKMIAKTALGAEMLVPWERRQSLDDLMAGMRQDGYTLAALEKIDGAIDISEYEPSFPLALILGHEVDGVPAEVMADCDVVLSIPMRGQKQSLNVAVAAGIAMYELLR